jgi:hypothetical protein
MTQQTPKGYLGHGLEYNGNEVCLLAGLKGDLRDEVPFVKRFKGLGLPIYRATARSGMDLVIGLFMVTTWGEGQEVVFRDLSGVALPEVPTFNAPKDLILIQRTIDLQLAAKDERDYRMPILPTPRPGDLVAIKRRVWDGDEVVEDKYLGGVAFNPAWYEQVPPPPQDLHGVVLPAWNPQSKTPGGRRAVYLFAGENGRQLMWSLRERFIGAIEILN